MLPIKIAFNYFNFLFITFTISLFSNLVFLSSNLIADNTHIIKNKKIAIIISIAIILFSFLRIILMVGVAGFEPAQSSSQN